MSRRRERYDATSRCPHQRSGYGNRCKGGGQTVDEAQIRQRLEVARIEHRDLDAAIVALATSAPIDQLRMARLKKRKLMLKDEIAQLEDELIPDITA